MPVDIHPSWSTWERRWKLGKGIRSLWIRLANERHLISVTQIHEYPNMRCPHPICRYLMVDGRVKCPQCFRQIEPVTDANIATEVARREAMARTKGVPFSMDKVLFHHARRAKMSQKAQSSSSSGPARSRSNYGLLRDRAKNYVRSFRKRGFGNLVDRLQRDPLFIFIPVQCSEPRAGARSVELHCKACWPHQPNHQQNESPDPGGEALNGHEIGLCAVGHPRKRRTSQSFHIEVFVSHRGVFLDIGQFAVYVAQFIKPKGRPLPLVYGWNDQGFVPDADTSNDIAKGLFVEFSKLQWTIFASKQAKA